MTKLIAANRNFANMPKNQCCRWLYCLHPWQRGDRASFRYLVFKHTLMQLIAKDNFFVFTPYCFHNIGPNKLPLWTRLHTNFESLWQTYLIIMGRT
jgi:hypothetical protein